MDKIVHQIWVGGPIPEREAAWMAGVRSHAEAAGWQHKLWGWEELMEAYGSEPVADIFRRLMEDFPMPTTYTLASDYYRLRVLAEGGGVYLDTDFSASGWPEFPTEGVQYTQEFFKERATNCFFLCAAPVAMRMAANLAERYLLKKLPPGALDLPTRYIGLARRNIGHGGLAWAGVGPFFLCRQIIPAWDAAGIRHGCAERAMVSQRQWSTRAPLIHRGAARWHEGTRAQEDPFWRSMVNKAAMLTAAAMQRHSRAAMAELPPHLRPCGAVITPAPRPRSVEQSVRRSEPGPEPALFWMPKGVRRVVVLSNVTNGFEPAMVPLRAGDLCIHCNHSRHREAAMAVKGTRHWLFVRHGRGRDPRGWHWYHNGTYDGFERVFFIDDASMVRPFRWWCEYRAICGKSPTTGFIAANNMRELYPKLPLVLAGFDPGQKHGTPQWDGHDWKAEAAWYAQKRFRLIAPRKLPRVLVLICSCSKYEGRSIRAKGARQTYEQRRACRINWINRLTPSNVHTMFVVGRGPAIREPLVHQLDVEDGYWDLPAKMRAAFRHALATDDFDWLYKCDDDSFVHLGRLAEYVSALPSHSRNIYGAPIDGQDTLSGGGGYVLHRDMVERIVADPAFPDTGREDVEVCEAVKRAGGNVVKEKRFNMHDDPAPNLHNDLISAHHLSPRMMRKIHIDCFLL